MRGPTEDEYEDGGAGRRKIGGKERKLSEQLPKPKFREYAP